MDAATILSSTATFAGAALAAHLPGPVEARLGSLLLEGLSWMAMGTRRPEGARLLARWRTAVAGTGSAAGCAVRVPLAEAARINASLSQIHDGNDGRRMAWLHAGLWHPGRYIIPTALALAEHHRLGGGALLRLMALGYDIGGKLQTGPNEVAGSLAVAAMAAAAARLPPAAARRAIVLGYFSFPQPPRWPGDGDLNHLKYGLIVRAALEAAQSAEEVDDLPEGQCGIALREPFYDARPADPEAYECMHLYIKPYTACRALHGAISLALRLRAEDGLRPEDVARIEVVAGNAREPMSLPFRRGDHYKCAQFSIPYTVACALADGEVGAAQFDAAHLGDEAIHALQQRITVTQEDAFAAASAQWREPARMRVITRDGRELERHVEIPPGSHLAPLGEAELRGKFIRWTAGALDPARQQEAIRLAAAAGSLPSVEPIAALLRSVRPCA